MTIKFTTTAEQGRFAKVMVYGESGCGKTTLCGTLTDNIIISAEKGLLCLADKDIPVIEINTAADALEALQFIQTSAEAKQFNTVSVDSATDIAEVVLSDYMATLKDGRQAYSKMYDEMSRLIRAFRDLTDKNVYMTAQIGHYADEYSGLIKYAPSAPGKQLNRAMPYFFDEVLPLRIHEEPDGSSWRYLQTGLDLQYIAKDRSGKLDVQEMPDLGNLFKKMLTPRQEKVNITPVTKLEDEPELLIVPQPQ